ncbi:MAG: ATPase, partial [Candidatus Magasanikbacteria bacterium]|nr:ATPase [Candidatus Magasanikbacteria bacterium]
SKASAIFEHEYNVFSALDSLNIDSSFFSDAMNELRAVMENAEERFNMLDEVNVEDVLNRIEELSDLKRRYGSIEDALRYKEQKILELAKYENIEITKGDLVAKESKLDKKVKDLAYQLSQLRSSEIESFRDDLNKYLKELYLRGAQVEIIDAEYGFFGKDEVLLKLNETNLQKISTGEFNRLRLAVLALKSEFMSKNGGVLMLDEIDANLSGEESMSVAKVLKQLSQYFQIFVISHQPQLTSMGDQHFLVYKNENESHVRELGFDERIDEIARIISGESITQEAKGFAKELLGLNK